MRIFTIIIKRIASNLKKQKPTYKTPIKQKEIYILPEQTNPDKKESIKWDTAFIKSLEWKRYEEVCTEYLKLKNCNANVTSIGADGGIDIKINDNQGNLFAIAQCKSWNKPIGVSLIRELYGVMASENIKYGIFLTTSIFSPDALEFAQNKTLILIDADEFINLINNLDEPSKQRINQIATEGDYTTPTCVKCNVKMVKRTAKKGNNAGNEFWGCANYPRCKHKMFVKA
jgi:restriction system protein